MATPSTTKYVIRFFCEPGGGCLWPGNAATHDAFNLGPYDVLTPCPLPLSANMLSRCRELSVWYDASFNWDYPPDPGPWRQPECDRFNTAVLELVADIQIELGSNFDVMNEKKPLNEDPELGSSPTGR